LVVRWHSNHALKANLTLHRTDRSGFVESTTGATPRPGPERRQAGCAETFASGTAECTDEQPVFGLYQFITAKKMSKAKQ